MDDVIKTLKLYYQNTRGLRTKTKEFYKSLLLLDADVIMITETWLCEGIRDAELCDSKYVVFRKDRGSLGGGVMILCASRLQARMRSEWSSSNLESIWITIPAQTLESSSDLHIAVVYIPPNSDLTLRIKLYISLLTRIRNDYPNDHFIITGDFNLPCINWNFTNPVVLKKGSVEIQNTATNLITQSSFLGLSQLNCMSNKNNNILDLVFSDSSILVNKSDSSLVKEDLYHPALIIKATDILIPSVKNQSRIKYNFNRADYGSINDFLEKQNWSFIMDTNNINIEEIINRFYIIINNSIESFVPQVRCSGNYVYPVWYSRALIHIIIEKAKVHRNWKKYRNPIDYAHFSELRYKQKNLQDECYKSYIIFTQQKIKSNPKIFWSYIKSKRQNKSCYPQQMIYNNTVLSSHSDIVSAFNNFFERNFSKPSVHYSIQSLNDNFKDDNIIQDIIVTTEEISKLIKCIDITKGPGCDHIPPLFFVKCSQSLSVPITLIFNRCFQEGYFPNTWKKAHIVPIHKKGQQTEIENYRPISILNVLSKLCEKVVHSRIYPIVAKSIPTEQHGFMKARSTTTNLGVFIDHVSNAMDGGSQVDVIYTDFEKAFDRVDHIILLRKLCELGICGNLLRWMESYLRNRSQAVVVGGCRSDFIYIPSGVPQGSILGPLLYAIYLYDVGKCLYHARFLMYADDTKVYMRVTNEADCMNLQSDLDRLVKYYADNRITVNLSKCSIVSFTRKKNPIQHDYTLNNDKVIRANSIRDLGVLIDAKLTFANHFDAVVNKAYKKLGFILRVSQSFSDVGCLKVLYFSYVRSILEYCSVIWNPQYITYIQKIECIQCKFIKRLNFQTYKNFKDYEESCKYYHLMTLEDRRILTDMYFLYCICNGYLDSSELSSRVLTFNVPKTRTRHSRNRLFGCQDTVTNYAQNSLINRMHRTFNKKFNHIDIFNTSKAIFKREIKQALDKTSK